MRSSSSWVGRSGGVLVFRLSCGSCVSCVCRGLCVTGMMIIVLVVIGE